MQTTLFTPTEPSLFKRAARRMLTGERLVTGLLLVVWGLVGLFSVMSHGALPTHGAQMPVLLANVGFLFPLLKGLEILLKLYTSSDEPSELVVASPVRDREVVSVLPVQQGCRRERRARGRTRTTDRDAVQGSTRSARTHEHDERTSSGRIESTSRITALAS